MYSTRDVLYSWCILGISNNTVIQLLLYWYCIDIVLILYWYCIGIVIIIYNHHISEIGYLIFCVFPHFHHMLPSHASITFRNIFLVSAFPSHTSFRVWNSSHSVTRSKPFGNRSFCFSAPSAWDSLPKNLHDNSLSRARYKGLLSS